MPEPPRRLHWGCGDTPAPGWVNSDLRPGPGVDVVADIREGLPLEDESFDCVFSQHALPELGIYEQVDALRELRRVLRPGGVLRLSLPDLDWAIEAYRAGDRDHFKVWDWETISGNFIAHVLWYGITRTPFTFEFAEELLRRAGFSEVSRVCYRQTAGPWPGVAELDDRPEESFYVEAVR